MSVVGSAEKLWSSSDIVAKVRPPEVSGLRMLGEGKTLVSIFCPLSHAGLLEVARKEGATVMAMNMIPRISRAQKSGAPTSMGGIADYRAAIEAARPSAGSSAGK